MSVNILWTRAVPLAMGITSSCVEEDTSRVGLSLFSMKKGVLDQVQHSKNTFT